MQRRLKQGLITENTVFRRIDQQVLFNKSRTQKLMGLSRETKYLRLSQRAATAQGQRKYDKRQNWPLTFKSLFFVTQKRLIGCPLG